MKKELEVDLPKTGGGGLTNKCVIITLEIKLIVVVVCLTFVCTKMFTIIEDKSNIERIERFIFI